MARRPLLLQTALGALLAGFAAVGAPAQRPPLRELPHPIEYVGSRAENLFSVNRSLEDIHEWEQALTDLQAGEATAAVERLHKLLQSENGGVVPVAPGRFLGLRLAVVSTLANLPAAAVEAYEALVRREAGNLGARPLAELDQAQLELLARRFPTSSLGSAARLRLGDLALEEGRALDAVDHFRQALDAAPIGSASEQRATERLACATALAQPRTARAALAAKTLPAPVAEVLSVLPETNDPTGCQAIGGGDDGRRPMAEPAGRPTSVASEPIEAPGFVNRFGEPLGTLAMHAVGDLDGVYVDTGHQLIAYDPLRRAIAWVSPAPMRDGAADGRDDGNLNPNGVLAAAVGGDVVVAALQVPDPSVAVDFDPAGIRVMNKIPLRRLFGFSRSTGKLLWAHYDELDGPRTRRFRGHDSCGPPLVVGDTVYAPIHDRSGAIAFAIGAYDLHTGVPKWRRLVCSSQQEVNMFGNARMEFAASPLSTRDGVLFGASNLGVVFALEVATGRVRWIAAHDVVQMPKAEFRNQRDRAVYFANSPPVVAAGVVCFTPLDSPFVLGIDAETGRMLWRLPFDAPVNGIEHSVRWLAGALDDEFVLAGRGAVAVRARPEAGDGTPEVRQLVAPARLRNEALAAGRPAVTADHVWFVGRGRVVGFDRAGNAVADELQVRSPRLDIGNLLLADGLVLVVSSRSLELLADYAAIEERTATRLRATPDDPALLLRLATLRRALLPDDAPAAALTAIGELYRRGIAACTKAGLPRGHGVHHALLRGLFDQSMAAAARALDTGAADAPALLAVARDAAPDQRSWIDVQVQLVLRLLPERDRARAELDRLEREAGEGAVEPPDGPPIAVRTWVLWQRARQPELRPAEAAALWQRLLEEHADERLGGETAAALAEASLAALVTRHGAAVYAPIEARAAEALRAANDAATLRAVVSRFPNSTAAGAARTRLLDLAVAAGDLAGTCEVLAPALAAGAPAPGLLRRVLEAAQKRGNLGLARAVAARLAGARATTSDWPADGGAPYGEVLDRLAPSLAPAAVPPRLRAPTAELAQIRRRTPKETLELPLLIRADGFTAPTDVPLFVHTLGDTSELLAIDLAAPGPQKPILWSMPTQYIDQLILCGGVLVVPDLERLVGVDARTGAIRWDLPGSAGRYVESHGVLGGVLHVSATANDPASGTELLGIEPLSGRLLYQRQFPGVRSKPKVTESHLLWMQPDENGGASVQRLDPLDGTTVATVPIAATILRPNPGQRSDGLEARVYPQCLCADRQRIYLPIEGAVVSEAPRLLAIDDRGTVVWQWLGQPGRRLPMVALRGDRLVVAEGAEERPGRLLVLGTADGSPVRTTDLGVDPDLPGWQRSWLPTPAPEAVLVVDQPAPRSRERRLWCFFLDDRPGFVVPLPADTVAVERHPQFGDDLVVFATRPARNGQVLLHAFHLGDRSGALTNGEKYRSLGAQRSVRITSSGPFTVVQGTDNLIVLGPTVEPPAEKK